MRKTFTASQKAAIVLEVMKEEKTIVQIASENGVHQTKFTTERPIISQVEKQTLENFQQLCEPHPRWWRGRSDSLDRLLIPNSIE